LRCSKGSSEKNAGGLDRAVHRVSKGPGAVGAQKGTVQLSQKLRRKVTSREQFTKGQRIKKGYKEEELPRCKKKDNFSGLPWTKERVKE